MKRWIIRSFFIGLLMLFVGGWAVSGYYWLAENYITPLHPGHRFLGQSSWGVGIACGDVWLGRVRDGNSSDKYGFVFNAELIQPCQFWPTKNMAGQVFDIHFGFAFARNVDPESEQWVFGIPFWSLILVSGSVLWWVWRKTRPKAKGRAFPVEAAKSSEKP